MADKQNLLALIIEARDQASATIKKIDGAVVEMAKNAEKSSQTTVKASGNIGASFQQLFSVTNVLKVGIVGAFSKMVMSAIDYGDQMAVASKKTGATTEDLSRLSYAATQGDVSFEAITTSLSFLNRNLFAASQGSKGATEAFDRLHISIKNADGTMKSSKDILLDLAGAYESGAVSEQAMEASLIQLAGRGGKELIPFLKQGKTAIVDMMGQADKFGVVVSGDTAAAMNEFKDSLDRLKQGMLGISMSLAKDVLPMLEKLVKYIQDALLWFNKIDPQIVKFGVTVIAGYAAVSMLVSTYSALNSFFQMIKIEGAAAVASTNLLIAAIVVGIAAGNMLANSKVGLWAKYIAGEKAMAQLTLEDAESTLKYNQAQLKALDKTSDAYKKLDSVIIGQTSLVRMAKDNLIRIEAEYQQALKDKQDGGVANVTANLKKVHDETLASIQTNLKATEDAEKKREEILQKAANRELDILKQKANLKTETSEQEFLTGLILLQKTYAASEELTLKFTQEIEDQKLKMLQAGKKAEIDLAEKNADEAKKIADKAKEDFLGQQKDLVDSFIRMWESGGAKITDIFQTIGKAMVEAFVRKGLDKIKEPLQKFINDTSKQFDNLLSGKGFNFNELLGPLGGDKKRPEIDLSGMLGGLDKMTGGIGGAIGGALGGIGAMLGPVGAVLGPLAGLIGGLFEETPKYGKMALEAQAKTIDKIQRLWANAVDKLGQDLEQAEKGQSNWEAIFANTLAERKSIEEQINALGANEVAKKAELQAKLETLENKKVDLAALGIKGLTGFATYEEGLKKILMNHMTLIAGSNEAEKKELDKKKQTLDALQALQVVYSKHEAQGNSWMGLQEELKAAREAYTAATGEQMEDFAGLSDALSEATEAYYTAQQSYASGAVGQDELSAMIADMKTYQEATGASQEDMIALMGPQIEALEANGALTALQAEALRQSIGMSQGVRDALKAQNLATLESAGVTGQSVDAVKEQLKAMGLSLTSEGQIVDAENNVYGSVTSLDGKVTSLVSISTLLMSAQERGTKASENLLTANNKLKDAVYALKVSIDKMPGHASGGYIPQTHMAVVHAGEYIVPAKTYQSIKEMIPNLSMGPMAGSGESSVNVVVNVNGGVVTTDPESLRRFYRDNLQKYIIEDQARKVK